MLVTVQLPFIDVRHFLPREVTGQLPLVSAFTGLSPGEDFIRAFGPLRRRRRGGDSAWPGEELYANAARALRFDRDLPAGGEAGQYRFRAAFRRLMADGTATVRVDTGLAVSVRWDAELPAADALVAAALDIPVAVRSFPEPFARTALGSAGGGLARHFRRSTTSVAKQVDDAPSWWCQDVPPAVLIESSELGPPARALSPVTGLEDRGIRLYHWYQPHQGKDVDVWLLSNRGADKGMVRRVRIHLLRLHAEWQSLRAVLRLLGRERIPVEPHTPHTNRLQAYLNQKTNLVNKRRLDGMPQSELLAAAYRTDELVHAGERSSVRTAAAAMRPNLRRTVESLASESRRPRILMLAANPLDQEELDLGHEHYTIDTVLYNALQNEFELKQFGSVEPSQLQSLMERMQPHIVHFTGHGQSGAVVLEDAAGMSQPVAPAALARLFELARSPVSCVVLNVCGSMPAAEAIGAHVDVVLGTARDISDADAIDFSRAFYSALGRGDGVQRAYDLAVNHLDLQSRTNVTQLVIKDGVDAGHLTMAAMAGG